MAKILIVEDDAAIAAIERDYLSVSGFEVEIAEDGNSGLRKGSTRSARRALPSFQKEPVRQTWCGCGFRS